MDRVQVEKDIEEWMDRVGKRNKDLGHAICPYAAQAKKEKRVKTLFCAAETFRESVRSLCNEWDDHYEVVALVIEGEISADELFGYCYESFESELKADDFFLLPDHPQRIVEIDGVGTRNGKVPLILVQRLSRLNEASLNLMKGSYYSNWDSELMDEIVHPRFR